MLSVLFKKSSRLLIVLGLLLAFSAGVFVAAPTSLSGVQAETVYQKGGEDTAAVYNEVSYSVVNLVVTTKIDQDQIFEFPDTPEGDGTPEVPFEFDMPDDFFSQGQGSGFVYDMEGHIVTNYHVIESAERIVVTFRDGTQARAEVIGTDPESDIAVLRVDVDPEILRPVTFADTEELYVGQPVLAIGSPFSQDWTLTTGIVSALDRTMGSGFTAFSISSVIQTDAAINPGNSGGPLLDIEGNVIGVNAQIMSRSSANSGVGFAIPGNLVQKVVKDLIERGDYKYAWLGISGQSLSLELREILDLPANQRGVLIGTVSRGGPADKGGLRGSSQQVEKDGIVYQVGGDIIVAINGEPVPHMDALIAYLVEKTQPGDEATLEVLRNGKTQTLTVTLGERSEYTAE
ncbi:MAG: trypsin-like peptidase domain-containing protein [Anaerolineae bacterium]|nr:trypsin-like peptidase domain-containing protein [Anaerolineae bacterium]